jgi:excisionase family DNA binding protein
MEEKKLVYSVDEVAEMLHISRPSAFQGVRNGQIPHIRVGRRILIPVCAFEKMLAEAGSKVTV